MQKTVLLHVCLTILLVGIVMVPSVFAETHIVTITSGSDCAESIGGCFIPSVLTIQVGDTVTWKNSDVTEHTVTSDPPGFFDSGFMFENDSFSHTFNQDDRKYDYLDIIDKSRGVIIVGNPVELTVTDQEEITESAVEELEVEEEVTESVQQTSGGCGAGTVLVDGVCQLAPEKPGEGCGAGTVMVNGVCQLDKTTTTSMSIEPLYIAIGAVAIGAAIVGIIFAVRRGSGGTKRPKPVRQDLEEYEEQYLRRQGQRPRRKPTELRLTPSSCNSCGKPLKPTAEFCGKCGAKQ